MKIIVNKIQCKHCKDILESKSVHDFKLCKCGKVGVDGDLQYLRRQGTKEDYIELSITQK